MGEGTPKAHLVAVDAAIVALMRHLEPSNLQISAQHFLRVIVAYPGEVVRFKGMAQVGRGWSNATKEGIFLHSLCAAAFTLKIPPHINLEKGVLVSIPFP